MGVNMMQHPICDIVILTKLKTFNCGMQFIKILYHKTFLSLNTNPQYKVLYKRNALSSLVLKTENHN